MKLGEDVTPALTICQLVHYQVSLYAQVHKHTGLPGCKRTGGAREPSTWSEGHLVAGARTCPQLLRLQPGSQKGKPPACTGMPR